MSTTTSLRVRSRVRLATLLLLLLSGLALRPQSARASHLRAGDIRVTFDTTANAPAGSLRVFFRMILYTNNKNTSARATNATIFFGDFTSSCIDGIARTGPDVPYSLNPDVSINVFYFEHTYPSARQYTVHYIGENRVASVRNMSNSASQDFYIGTTFSLNPTLGRNHSPVLRTPAVDAAAVGRVFLHNPAAYDADGDSLSYQLAPSRQVPGGAASVVGPPCPAPAPGNNNPIPQPCTDFHYPNDPIVTAIPPVQVAYSGPPVGVPGAPAIFVMDPLTGQITWNAPVLAGEYNVAMEVIEWRRYPGRIYTKIGTVIRDLQITVVNTANLPPTLTIPPNLCVIAGQTATGIVTATDGIGPNTTQTPVTLFAYSGILPPATFVQSQFGPPTAQGTFVWPTNCNNVAKEPYLVVFKAQDSPTPLSPANPPLVDIRPWLITVVGPPPQNLVATPTVGNPNSMRLSWNTYTCANAEFINIYRKTDPSTTFVPSACLTGIPASAGYTFVARVPASATSFVDTNVDPVTSTVRGFTRGVNYCYRIYADFPLPALGQSIASNEACAQIPGRAALLTKVDVLSTAASTGQMQVCWTQPRTGTAQGFDGSLSYVLSRAEGLNPAATAYLPVATITTLTDTCYTDSNLNTLAKQYSYKLDFVRSFPVGTGAPITETAAPASSVRVGAVPRNSGTAATVSWTFNVPWDNTAQPTLVYRKGQTGGYVQVGTGTSTGSGGTYADNDRTLVKGQQYCYYVQTVGRYAGFAFLSSLPNRSQESCVTLNAPPCTPILTLLTTNCDSLANLQEFPRQGERYTNRLRWTLGSLPTGCDPTIASYRVYYRPTPTGLFTLLGTTAATSAENSPSECPAVLAGAKSGRATNWATE
ncbi:MAG: hypothetical protein M3Y54_13890, partial [Bacteroidota bacterium]|nr:hypothetical protein [Bacteroidota bacterium]